ncbi:MAG: hypothetical protein K1000chlam1_01654 [Candidatus Anoxychlamydiales bacterium]|nr:hypothetical protein [Candidatus Anoxychlamydiales bacterium]
MKHRKLIIIIVLLFFPLIIFSVPDNTFLVTNEERPDFLVLTIPKSGTYLFDKLMKMILLEYQKETHITKKYLLQHCNGITANEFLNNRKKIITIRDMRDVCISLTLNFRKGFSDPNGRIDFPQHYAAPYSYYYKWASELSLNIQLLNIIDGNLLKPLDHCKVQSEAAKEWMKTPNTYVCRFENLIGEEGGGSKDLQIKEIKQILKFLNINLSKDVIIYIAKNLYGNNIFKSKTFRRGEIGYWKEYFTEEHKQLFKEKLGKYLILWGYEKDNNW